MRNVKNIFVLKLSGKKHLPQAMLISFSITRSRYFFRTSFCGLALCKISTFFSRISLSLSLHAIHSSDFKFLVARGKNEKLITLSAITRQRPLQKCFLLTEALEWMIIYLTWSLCEDNERQHCYRFYNNFSLIQSHLMLVN